MTVGHARLLVEKSAATAARDGVDPRNGEGAIRSGPDRIRAGLAAEKARGIDGREPRASARYFLEISQCPTATCGKPERSKVSTASVALHTTGSPWRLKEGFSTAATPVGGSDAV